jgi:hypothetical protein
MAEWKKNGTVETLEIAADERRTLLLRSTPPGQYRELAQAIALSQARVALLIFGGAQSLDEETERGLKKMIGSALLPAAQAVNALLLDGTPPATMQLIGRCAEFRRHSPLLLAVVPESLITYPGSPSEPNSAAVPLDPNHSHYVLVPGVYWGDEWRARYGLALAISATLPVIAILLGGDEGVRRDLLSCVRQGWRVIVVNGTGGLADELASQLKALKPEGGQTSALDPEEAEILESPSLHVVQDADWQKWAQAIEGRAPEDATLRAVWDDYRRWDCAARAYQRRFRQLQWTVVALGVLVTLLAILLPEWKGTVDPDRWINFWHWAGHYAVIAIPILTTGLLAFINRFRHANRWVLLRGGAEAIKRGIFRYRVRAGDYSDEQAGIYRGSRLALEVDKITKALAQSEVNRAGVPKVPAVSSGEDPLTTLSGDQYAKERIEDQLEYYEKTTRRLDTEVKRFHALIYVAGGIGTFLAAIGFNVWVALTTAVVTALTARLEAEQKEASLAQYNQARARLQFVLNWWNSLSSVEKEEQRNRNRLVDDTENALQGELAGWVQQMQAALDQAQKALEEAASKKGAGVSVTPKTSEQAGASARGGQIRQVNQPS